MFQQIFQPVPQRTLKTSEPRFKRLSRVLSPESKLSCQQNCNPATKTYALDNSKQNLFYESHLTKVRSACKLDETAIVSKYLSSIRKDYDEMSKLSRKELNTMRLKKREIDFMRQKNLVFCDKRKELQVQIEKKQTETSKVRTQEEEAKMQTKTLQNIIVRMKKDQIFYKLYGRIKDEQLKTRIKQVKLLDQNLIHEQEKLHKLNASLQDCKDLYSKNKEVREKKFEDFSGKISDVRERDRFIHERKERTYELQSIELNDTLDQKNIHMREIILAHKVADSLLQGKVSTLIKRYSDIQSAFHLVKIKTGVSQPQHLTSKFFSYEQISENLLETISENERYVQELRKKKTELLGKVKQLNHANLLEDDSGIVKNEETAAVKEKLTQETNQNKLLMDQIGTWIDRMLAEVNHSAYSKSSSPTEKLQVLCQSLRANFKRYQHFNLSEQRTQTMGVCLKKMVHQKSAEQLSIRLRQTQDMNESNLIEQEYISCSRKNVYKRAFTIKQVRRDSHL